MKLSDFDFDLPDRLIATRPVSPRPSARMLVADATGITDANVYDLKHVLRPGDRLILNNTKVIPARLIGTRVRGDVRAKVEITLLEPGDAGQWSAMAKPLRKLAEGDVLEFRGGVTARVMARGEDRAQIAFDGAVDASIEAAGDMPLPPYIAAKRPADAQDRSDYQTVFAKHKGAVAAPTASLHFDQALLDDLRAMGVAMTEVTLHVGAGTFLPVKVDDISQHKMHAEWGEVTEAAVAEIAETRAKGGRIITVGTTALRLVEASASSGTLRPFRGETDIFITPGFQFKVADGLMTNFHLPKSTLMMLVSAVMGAERIRDIYAHAIANDYRFFSYGDASLLLPERSGPG